MFKIATFALVGSAFLAGPASAVSVNLDLEFGDEGQLQEPLTATDPDTGVTATFNNSTPGQTNLDVADDLAELTSDGICAGDRDLLGVVDGCDDLLEVGFSEPVDNLGFDITGVELVTGENITFFLDNDTSVTASDSDLVDLSLLGAPLLGTRVMTELQQVIGFTFETDALLGVNAGYVGDIRFDVERDDDGMIGGGVAAVPAPAALPLMAAGLGALGWIGRRRSR